MVNMLKSEISSFLDPLQFAHKQRLGTTDAVVFITNTSQQGRLNNALSTAKKKKKEQRSVPKSCKLSYHFYIVHK